MTDQELVAAVKAAVLAYIAAVRAAETAGLNIETLGIPFPGHIPPGLENTLKVRGSRMVQT